MKVAYVVSLFPKISETFILREMQALRRLGAEIVIVSLKNRREEIVHPGAEAFLADTIYAGDPGAAAAALLGRALARPLRTASVLGRVAAGCLTTQPSDLAKSIPLVAAASRVAKILRAEGADRVHAHWATYPGLVAWAVKRLEGIPYSMTAHAHDIFGLNPLLERKILDSDFTVTISEFNRRTLARACGEEALRRIHVIRCGVPLGEYALRPAAPAGPFRIVSIGRLVDYKGFPTLLRAVADLRARGRDVVCDIVGDGPLEPLLRLAIREQGLDGSVRLTGPKTLEDVRALLSSASACVLACERGAGGLMDGIPVVLMEAMALGVPAVSTRISGLPELIEDGRTGLLATPGDPRSLAEAIDLVLSDPGLAANMAGAARRKIEDQFDADRNAGALLDLMTSASAGRGL